MKTDRKKDHIDLAKSARTSANQRDTRFFYEPALTTHPDSGSTIFQYFLGKQLSAPIWVSSMTGGTKMAKIINENLARACADFGLGMGLGSCRNLLLSDQDLPDFAVRKYIKDQPLYANLGIAQINELIEDNQLHLINDMLSKLEADGLIVHLNPVQEWIQPEGDHIIGLSPVKAVEVLLDKLNTKVVVKEVGQGMGPESLSALLQLPIAALEFGAFGGTNFAKLEALRQLTKKDLDPICYVGHTAIEMIEMIKNISKRSEIKCHDFIISGGISNYLDGYYHNESLPFNSVYGQAGAFLAHAKEDYDKLAKYVDEQIQGYKFAMRYLRVKDNR